MRPRARQPSREAEPHAGTGRRLTRAGIAFAGPFAAGTAASPADYGGSGDHRHAVARYWLAEDLTGAERLTYRSECRLLWFHREPGSREMAQILRFDRAPPGQRSELMCVSRTRSASVFSVGTVRRLPRCRRAHPPLGQGATATEGAHFVAPEQPALGTQLRLTSIYAEPWSRMARRARADRATTRTRPRRRGRRSAPRPR
jgi:hypothetical protein